MTPFLEIIQSDPSLQANYQYGKYATLLCPYHEDTSPSAWLNIYTGNFGCHRCVINYTWDEFAEHQGYKPNRNIEEYKNSLAPLVHLTKDWNKEIKPVLMQNSAWDEIDPVLQNVVWYGSPTEPWRGICPELLQAFPTSMFLAIKERPVVKRIAIPCTVHGITYGFVKAGLTGLEIPKYQNTSSLLHKGWVRDKGLLGFDQAIRMPRWSDRILFIVEGPRDVMHMLQCGIPAMGIMSAKGFNWQKAQLIASIIPSLVVVLLDNDANHAGQKGTEKVIEYLTKAKIRTYNANNELNFNTDPADLPWQRAEEIYQKMRLI